MKTTITMLALILFMFSCKNNAKEKDPKPSAQNKQETVDLHIDDNYLKGVDIHDINTRIDWKRVKDSAGISFIIMKATDGKSFGSEYIELFRKQWANATSIGLIKGAYHYYEPTDSPESQAHFYDSIVHKIWNSKDLPPILDLEEPPVKMPKEQYRNDVKQWLKLICKKFNRKPIIYVSPDFANTYLDDTFDEYYLWQAEYGVPSPRIIWKENDWTLWQHAEKKYNVPGFGEWVDLNYFNGVTIEDLKNMQWSTQCE